jgi:hypothetical protein
VYVDMCETTATDTRFGIALHIALHDPLPQLKRGGGAGIGLGAG